MAERGTATVSMRMVCEAAGHRNHSAVQFHFGSRDGLLQAIAAERMRPITERRQEMLAELDRGGHANDLRGLVAALVVPLAERTLGVPGSHYARFLAASYADAAWSSAVHATAQGRAFENWRERLETALPDLPAPLRRARVDRAVTSVIVSLAGWEANCGRRGLRDATLVADLIATTVAGLTAPPPVAGSPGEPNL
jgi:AcrR family transcriptional regulator